MTITVLRFGGGHLGGYLGVGDQSDFKVCQRAYQVCTLSNIGLTVHHMHEN
jgi:hypothetical protein